MLLLSSVAAPILPGPQGRSSHRESLGVTRAGTLNRPGFVCGSSSRLWAGRTGTPACRIERSRAAKIHRNGSRSMPIVRAIGDPAQSTFLSLEEAGLIEMTNLDMHEKFLARLTVSSLNLLRAISKQEGVPIEELNAGKLCDWFVNDKEKRGKNIEEATLKWDSSEW